MRDIRQITIALIMALATIKAAAQVTITGTVIASDDKSLLPGVNVVEKGTSNGTTTTADGTFSIDVTDANATLVFSFVGMVTQEVPLNGRQTLFIKAKWDCNKDFFDSQHVMLTAVSGLVNTPLGGQIEVASPWVLGGIVRGQYGFQTDLGKNELETAKIELAHYISNCDFDIDFRWSFRRTLLEDELTARANSFEVDFNTRDIKLIGGYSHLRFNDVESGNRNLSGVLLGFGKGFNVPLYPTAIVRVGLYDGKIEYMGEVQGGRKHFVCFLRFYKLDAFNELSVGVGAWIGY